MTLSEQEKKDLNSREHPHTAVVFEFRALSPIWILSRETRLQAIDLLFVYLYFFYS